MLPSVQLVLPHSLSSQSAGLATGHFVFHLGPLCRSKVLEAWCKIITSGCHTSYVTPGCLPLIPQVMSVQKKSTGELIEKAGLRSRCWFTGLGCSPEGCTFTNSLPQGGRVQVRGRLHLEEWYPREMGRGISTAHPPGSPALSSSAQTSFVIDVAEPSGHNLKTK
jgi:hypothetical protein